MLTSHGRVLKRHLHYAECQHRNGMRHYTDCIKETNCLDCLWRRAHNKTLTKGARRYAQNRAQEVQNGIGVY